MIQTNSKDPLDPNYRKIVYVRYADDWIMGVRGSKVECVNLLKKIEEFLEKELNLKLSEKKTLITNATNEKALFLGVSIGRASHRTYSKFYGFPRRNVLEIRLEAPLGRINKKLTKAGFLKGKMPVPKLI